MRSKKPDEAADEERMKFRELYCDAAIEHAPNDPESLTILTVLARKYADWNTGERCWPSDEELAKYARCSERTVRRRREILEKAGWFETWREHGKGICYRLIIPSPDTESSHTGHRVQSHRTQSPVTPDTESSGLTNHRTQSPDQADTESGGHWTQSPANKNQENKYQETKREEEVVDGFIDAENPNIDVGPPPPHLILEVGTPLAAREGVLPEEHTPNAHSSSVSDNEKPAPDVSPRERAYFDVCKGNAESLEEKYGSKGKLHIWSLRHGVITALEQLGLDEKAQRSWLATKFINLYSRDVDLKVWADALVDPKDITAHLSGMRDSAREERERMAQLRRNSERLKEEKLSTKPVSEEALALAARLFGPKTSKPRPELPEQPPGLTQEERERIEAEIRELDAIPPSEAADPLDSLPPDPGPIFFSDDDEVAQ